MGPQSLFDGGIETVAVNASQTHNIGFRASRMLRQAGARLDLHDSLALVQAAQRGQHTTLSAARQDPH
jgi:hypothetical protein